MIAAPRIAATARGNLGMSARLKALHAVFAAVDADHCGKVTPDEFMAAIQLLVGKLDDFEQRYLFHAFDFTRDGSIEIAEFDYALFRDVQVRQDSEHEAGNVQTVLTVKLKEKLDAFRAMTPEQRGKLFAPEGILNDRNAAAQQQAAIQKQQASGQGIVVDAISSAECLLPHIIPIMHAFFLRIHRFAAGASAGCAQVFESGAGILSVIGIIAVIVGIVVAIVTSDMALLAIAGVGYFIYLLASCGSTEAGLVQNSLQGTDALVEKLNTMYRANCAYSWSIECYHYETRTVTTTDSQGHSHTRTEKVRVVTHSASTSGRLHTFDASPAFVPALNSYALTQVLSSVNIQMLNTEYYAGRDHWRSSNTRDEHQDFSSSEDLPELLPELLVEYVPGTKPWWVSEGYFTLAVLTMLSLFYQVALNSICGRQEYVLEKKVTGFSHDDVSEEARQYDAEQAVRVVKISATVVAIEIPPAAAATPDDSSDANAAPPSYEASVVKLAGDSASHETVPQPPSYDIGAERFDS
jgi:Ca2+-binding EF-hand superfamily protein